VLDFFHDVLLSELEIRLVFPTLDGDVGKTQVKYLKDQAKSKSLVGPEGPQLFDFVQHYQGGFPHKNALSTQIKSMT
jgi:hypothetical protein